MIVGLLNYLKFLIFATLILIIFILNTFNIFIKSPIITLIIKASFNKRY